MFGISDGRSLRMYEKIACLRARYKRGRREIRRLRALKSPLQRGAIQLGLEVCIDSPCVRARNRKGFLVGDPRHTLPDFSRVLQFQMFRLRGHISKESGISQLLKARIADRARSSEKLTGKSLSDGHTKVMDHRLQGSVLFA